jgi:hypothetical protein
MIFASFFSCSHTRQCLVTNLNYGIRGVLVDALYYKVGCLQSSS